MLFRKLNKALNDRINQLTAAEFKAEQLIAALERVHLKKRKKVLPNPNKAFVQLQNVMEIKRRMKNAIPAPTPITPQNQATNIPVQKNTNNQDIQKCIKIHGSDSNKDYLDNNVNYKD